MHTHTNQTQGIALALQLQRPPEPEADGNAAAPASPLPVRRNSLLPPPRSSSDSSFFFLKRTIQVVSWDGRRTWSLIWKALPAFSSPGPFLSFPFFLTGISFLSLATRIQEIRSSQANLDFGATNLS